MEYIMKLSHNTLVILKNFASINSGLLFKQGKVLSTVSPQKNILCEAMIEDEFPKDFGIYDLNNFLSVVSLYKEMPLIEFDDYHVIFVGLNGRSKIKYRITDPKMITTPPDKKIVLPSIDIEFDLNSDDLAWIIKTANVLQSPHIAIESDGEIVNVTAFDATNDAAHTNSIKITDSNGSKYKMIFKSENLSKLIPDTYEVRISSKGIAHFKNESGNIQYWMATETGSNYED